METDRFGKVVPGYHTEVRTRWTKNNLYFLFICPYEQLHLKPGPDTRQETNQLWNWDVAEVFIGSDFADIQRYKEFEVSPQGGWVDLDVNLHNPHHEEGWVWNSGFEVLAKIDSKSTSGMPPCGSRSRQLMRGRRAWKHAALELIPQRRSPRTSSRDRLAAAHE